MKQILINNCTECPHAIEGFKVCKADVKIIKKDWPKIPKGCVLKDTTFERNIVEMMNRLYWLITQSPGVATYGDDVKLFSEILMQYRPEQTEKLSKLVDANSYE